MEKNELKFGLKSSEIDERRKKYGTNKLPEPKKKTWMDGAKDALLDPVTMTLIVIASIQIMLGFLGFTDLKEPVVIILVLCIVASIGAKTTMNVQRSSDLLRAKVATRYCNVIRDDVIQTINKDEIVVGDVVCLEAGQEIYADGYMIQGEISVNNSAINGETKEIRKRPASIIHSKRKLSTSDYTNEHDVFAGTIVTEGVGKMLVTSVGIHTVNGDTLVKMQTLEPPKTALDIALEKLSNFISKWGTIAAVVACVLMILLTIGKTGISEYTKNGFISVLKDIMSKVSVALSIIVAAVPEGLPMIVKLVINQNVSIMEKMHVLPKNPNKIPEMAYLNLVCTDKTGTLTTGIMTPELLMDAEENSIKKESKIWNILKTNLSLNNAAAFNNEGIISGGNFIDRALLSLVSESEYRKLLKNSHVKDVQAFQSKLKYSAVSIKDGNSTEISYFKGAPERILEKCVKYMDSNGDIRKITPESRNKIKESLKSANKKAIRCVGFSYKEESLQKDILPEDMIYVGFIGVKDPLRKEVKEAVIQAKKAGIQVIEMTGDALETAVAVAKEAGIYHDGDIAFTDEEFMKKSDEEIKKIFPSLKVIARCSPNTKLRLVQIAQEMNLSVSMTGDGTNDSSALKQADVGFAMNAGTDVAKEAGDIILTDNNFASIIRGIKLGRTFMHNINMFLDYQLPINIALLLINFCFPLTGKGIFLSSVLILILNIIMDSLNSLSFGSEPPKDIYMEENPFVKGTGLFNKESKVRIGTASLAFLFTYALLIFSPVKHFFLTGEEQMSARFALICIMAVMNGFCVRVDDIHLLKGISENKMFPIIALGIIIGTIFICNVLYGFFLIAPLSIVQWITIFILAALIIPIDFMRKIITKYPIMKKIFIKNHIFRV